MLKLLTNNTFSFLPTWMEILIHFLVTWVKSKERATQRRYGKSKASNLLKALDDPKYSLLGMN